MDSMTICVLRRSAPAGSITRRCPPHLRTSLLVQGALLAGSTLRGNVSARRASGGYSSSQTSDEGIDHGGEIGSSILCEVHTCDLEAHSAMHRTPQLLGDIGAVAVREIP